MGFLDKLFSKNNKSTEQNETKAQNNKASFSTVEEILQRYGGIVMDKQLDFGDVIGENNWNINIGNEEISFGDDLVFPIQVLGTISHATQTWLWAWANTKSGLSESIVQQALQLKKYGEDHQIDLLRNDSFGFTKEDLHLMGTIAAGIHNATAYYICDYGQGAMVVTIKDNEIDKMRKDNHLRILTVFPQLISQYEMNHKAALLSYLNDKGYSIEENASNITATKNGEIITAEFDEQSRLKKING
ncbi:DUF6882 domain-containing protein [Flavobacterium hercynium]|uniref:Uncharacterized protein n=1 Tax=Flavobacterium hercynium TaxID=387094 RepID=A0A226HN71_9FLAO|nr:DUF6882 domain-containing protein [Flavobacterium hercynium]OXA95562.1 hypothetical protein B0A66_02550 [Flavobacterium hercynium]SMP22854.1 hypothetical protein SAMN06265346_107207 [Flavobacterium hercynium]